MSHTEKRLAPGFQSLCEAVNVSALPFLSMDHHTIQKETVTVLTKISELSDAQWAALPPDAQALFDKAAEATNSGQDPSSLVIYTTTVEDEPAAAAPTGEAKTSASESKTPEVPTRKPMGTQTVKSESTGETKTAQEAPKGRFGGGQRKNPATDWARKYVIEHPEAPPAEVLKATLEQNFPHPISKGTVDAMVYEVRSTLRIISESGYKLVKS